jgi:hypothetical protein
MNEEITYEKVQRTLNEAPAAAKALAAVFQQAASDYVEPLEVFLEMLGLKDHVPASWLVQPVMVLAQKNFGKVTREDWIQLYDDMEALDRVIAEHPEIKENYAASQSETFEDVVAGIDLEFPEF